jgi:Leucine-rich repeat (LRR) protein
MLSKTKIIDYSGKKYNKIKVVAITKTKLSHKNTLYIRDSFEDLKDIKFPKNMSYLHIYNNNISNLSISHDMLKELYISETPIESVNLNCPLLETLQIHRSNIKYINFISLKNLKILYLSYCQIVSSDDIHINEYVNCYISHNDLNFIYDKYDNIEHHLDIKRKVLSIILCDDIVSAIVDFIDVLVNLFNV